MKDRRNPHPRYPINEKISLLVDHDSCRVFCELTNISLTGARLAGVPLKCVPATFRVLITSQNAILPCRVRWTSGSEIGVEFTGEPEFRKSILEGNALL
jgi:hypothetical protein